VTDSFSGRQSSHRAWATKLSEASRAVLDERIASIGASVVGRNTFEVSGRWGGTPPFAIPTFVVTHNPPRRPRASRTCGSG
jgi:hypothetical protein